MGKTFSRIMFPATRYMKTFNLTVKTERLLDSTELRPVPKYKVDMDQLTEQRKNMPEISEKIKTEDNNHLGRLRDVYVSRTLQSVEPEESAQSRPMPVIRYDESKMIDMQEHDIFDRYSAMIKKANARQSGSKQDLKKLPDSSHQSKQRQVATGRVNLDTLQDVILQLRPRGGTETPSGIRELADRYSISLADLESLKRYNFMFSQAIGRHREHMQATGDEAEEYASVVYSRTESTKSGLKYKLGSLTDRAKTDAASFMPTAYARLNPPKKK